GELAGDGGDDELFRFPARGKPTIAAMETPLGQPGVIDDGGWRAALPMTERIAEKRMMPIVPGRFDEHAAQMRIAGFGDRATDRSRAAGVLGWNETHEGHDARRGGKAAGVAEFGSDGKCGELVDAAEAAQALDAGAQRFDGEEVAQFEVNGLEAGDAF